jgi:hypothetical protein
MHRSFWAFIAIAFVLISGGAWAAPAAKPETVVQAYFVALQQNGMSSVVEYMHPDELVRFRDMLLPILAAEDADRKRDLRGAVFGALATLRDAEAATPSEFMAAFMNFASAQMGDVKPSFDKIEVLGSVPEGEVVHVVTRLHIGNGELAMRQMQVISVKPAGDVWRLMLSGEIEGFAQTVKARMPPPTRP